MVAKTLIHLIFLCIIAILMVPSSQARRPAVEPVMGISVDEYKEVAPEKTKPYNFTQEPQVEEVSSSTSTTNTPIVTQKALENSTDNPSVTTAILVIFLSLPFAVWWAIMKKLPQIPTRQRPQLKALEGGKSKEEETQDLPKAS